MHSYGTSRSGFTLVELLLVVAIIAVLMFITILAITPQRNLSHARNAQRRIDTQTISNAIYQYLIDKHPLPPSIPSGSFKQICKTGVTGALCGDGVDLNVVTAGGVYVPSLPVDPQAPVSGTGTNYWILLDSINRLIVDAPNAEEGEYIFVRK
ncbi:type II secretion system protein [Candidatus Peregrinibacteria bacterium]|nr:type II secretion system protein [Candidatus Peregrinibacteria bacterium]MBI3816167.1 type II secretion system protein [Candidatus Peregrinibacteria bacterium]